MGAKRSDKEAIHLEYISTDLSLRVLAKKHNMSVSTLQLWKNNGHWDVERKAMLAAATERAAENLSTAKAQALDSLTSRQEKTLAAADKLLAKVYQLLELEDALAPRDLKSISSTLLDIKMLTDVRDDVGEKEPVTIRFAGNADDYAN
ncbi:MAG: hypothetical protein ACI4P4_14455 [Faecousia sp.]